MTTISKDATLVTFIDVLNRAQRSRSVSMLARTLALFEARIRRSPGSHNAFRQSLLERTRATRTRCAHESEFVGRRLHGTFTQDASGPVREK